MNRGAGHVWFCDELAVVTLRSRLVGYPVTKRKDNPILESYWLFHNYIRPHKALDCKTPAEVAGIQIKGKDKWYTIIQNASRK